MTTDPMRERWFAGLSEETMIESSDDRDQLIEIMTNDYAGEPFYIGLGKPFRYKAPDFNHFVTEAFDDVNCEYGSEDEYPSELWKEEHYQELLEDLKNTMNTWLEKHGYQRAWALDLGPMEYITPETQTNDPTV